MITLKGLEKSLDEEGLYCCVIMARGGDIKSVVFFDTYQEARGYNQGFEAAKEALDLDQDSYRFPRDTDWILDHCDEDQLRRKISNALTNHLLGNNVLKVK